MSGLTVFELVQDEFTDAETVVSLKAVAEARTRDINKLTEDERNSLRRVFSFKRKALETFGDMEP